MKEKHVFKRVLSLLCAVAMLMGMVIVPNSKVSATETTYQEVTFADFGIYDRDVSGQLDGSLTGYTSMDGVAFTGYVKTALKEDDHYQTVRVGTKDRTQGIGIYTSTADSLVLFNFTQAYWGTPLKTISIADYGITYDEKTNMFSEFKLRMAFQYVGDTDVLLTVSINGIECYNQTVAGLQSNIGTQMFVWGNEAAMSLRSCFDYIDADFTEETFADFGISDQFIPSGNQIKGTLGSATTLDGVAFSGKIKMDRQADMYHSLRIGGYGETDATQWSGIGMWPEGTGTISFYHYTGVLTGSGGVGDIVKAAIADYGITYDETNETFSEFNLRMTFRYVPETTDVELTIRLNGKQCYNGVLAGVQSVLGNRLHVWANGGKTFTVKSIGDWTAEEPDDSFTWATFSDFNIADGTHASGMQQAGEYSKADTLDGIAFEGMVTFGDSMSREHSVRVGGASGSIKGVGLSPVSATKMGLYFFTGSSNTSNYCLKEFNIADYGVSYTAGTGYSALKLRIAFKYVENTNHVKVKVSINDQVCYNGILAESKANVGKRIFAWPNAASLTLASTTAPAVDVTYKEVTFADFGISDQLVTKGVQVTESLMTGDTSLDGIAFSGKVKMVFGDDNRQTIRIGGYGTTDATRWSGIGIHTGKKTSTTPNQLVLQRWTGVDTRTELTDRISLSDHGITYDSATGMYEFNLRMAFHFIPGTTDVQVTVTINDYEWFNDTVEGLQSTLGTRLHIWGNSAQIAVKSTGDWTAEEPDDSFTRATFSDFNIADGTYTSGMQQSGEYSKADTLDGVAFEGMVTFGDAMTKEHSVRVGGASSSIKGVGLSPLSATKMGLYFFTGSSNTSGDCLTEFNIADYGVSYTAGTGYSALKLRIAFKYVENTNHVKVKVSINDQACYSGILAESKSDVGKRIFAWPQGASLTLASTKAPIVEPTYKERSFVDFGIGDQIIAKGAQVTKSLVTGDASLDGIAVSGNIQIGFGDDNRQTIRIGGYGSDTATIWSGIGIHTGKKTAASPEQLVLERWTGVDTRTELTDRISLSDHGITYDSATGLYSFDLRMAFYFIPGTTDILVTVTINDYEWFKGTVEGLQSTFGTRLHIWTNSAQIAVKSTGDRLAEEPAGTYNEITYSDFGILDKNLVTTDQAHGFLQYDTSLDGYAFNGKIQFGYSAASTYESIRVGGTAAAGTSGVGLFVNAQNQLALYHFSGDAVGNYLGQLDITNYGMSYDAATGMSEAEIRMAFYYIPDTTDVKVNLYINGKHAYSGILFGAQETLGTRVFVWAYNAPIAIASVEEAYKEVTFSDFGIEDQTLTPTSNSQIHGELKSASTLDGYAFVGNIELGFALPASLGQSFRIGGSESDLVGIGFWPEANDNLAFFLYDGGGGTSGTDLKDKDGNNIGKIKMSDYGISYADGTFSQFKLRMAFKYLKGTNDIKLTIYLNDKMCVAAVLQDGQDTYGTKMFLWAHEESITVSSADIVRDETDFTEVTFSDFGVADQILIPGESNQQVDGELTDLTSLDGVAFNGKIQFGKGETSLGQSFRIGGSAADKLVGVGFWPEADTVIAMQRYTGDITGSDLAKMNIADYGITYNPDTAMYSEFELRMTFRNIPETRDMRMVVTINGKDFYDGVLTDAQDVFGTKMFLWAYKAPISVRSISVNEYFGSESKVNKHFDSFFAADGTTFSAGDFKDKWQFVDGVVIRKSDSADTAIGSMAMLALKDRTYKNFELSLDYYQAEGADRSLIIGVGAETMGSFFTSGAGNYGIAATGTNPWQATNLLTLDSSSYLTTGWHSINLTVTGRMVKAFVDNSSEYVVAVLPESYEGGYIYLAADCNQSRFRSFDITPLSNHLTNVGDANADGVIGAADVLRLKRHMNKKATLLRQDADFNNDNHISNADMSLMRKYVLGSGLLKSLVNNAFRWSNDMMPIGGYYGPTGELLTDTVYQNIKDAGFNLIVSANNDNKTSPDDFSTAMSLGEKYEIYSFAMDAFITGSGGNITETELRTLLQKYDGNDYCAGIRIVDEPSSEGYAPGGNTERMLSSFTNIASKVNQVSGMNGYINLFPYYSSMTDVTFEDYKGYVREYCDGVKNLKHLSYDHYVLDYMDRKTYFDNMSFIRDVAKEEGIPFWAFTQAGRSQTNDWAWNGRSITEAEFFWNVNTSLAMGAKGIQYYPLIQPNTALTNGVFNADGSKSSWFEPTKKINTQIAHMDDVLMNSDHEGIIAMGSSAVADTAGVSSRLSGAAYKELSGVTAPSGALIGCFNYGGKTALYVVNYDMENAQDITLQFASAVALTKYTSTTENLNASTTHSFNLAKGEAALFVVG